MISIKFFVARQRCKTLRPNFKNCALHARKLQKNKHNQVLFWFYAILLHVKKTFKNLVKEFDDVVERSRTKNELCQSHVD